MIRSFKLLLTGLSSWSNTHISQLIGWSFSDFSKKSSTKIHLDLCFFLFFLFGLVEEPLTFLSTPPPTSEINLRPLYCLHLSISTQSIAGPVNPKQKLIPVFSLFLSEILNPLCVVPVPSRPGSWPCASHGLSTVWALRHPLFCYSDPLPAYLYCPQLTPLWPSPNSHSSASSSLIPAVGVCVMGTGDQGHRVRETSDQRLDKEQMRRKF